MEMISLSDQYKNTDQKWKCDVYTLVDKISTDCPKTLVREDKVIPKQTLYCTCIKERHQNSMQSITCIPLHCKESPFTVRRKIQVLFTLLTFQN